MTKRPIRIFFSPLGFRFYASSHYKQKKPGIVQITGEKWDVTDDIAAAIKKYDLEFSPVAKNGGGQ